MEPIEFEQRIDITHLTDKINTLKTEIAKVLVAQDNNVDLILIALLSQGHILLEGMPGVAKTLMVKLLAKTIDVHFSRIQFTPDLMPSDVIGTNVFNPKTISFEFKKGPIFGNLILIDEINRAPAKTQSALFEVMEERQITVDSTTHLLPEPFMILATQNPVEHEGTYNLPEAQLDRFAFKLLIDYPSVDDEVLILQKHQQQYTMHNMLASINNTMTPADIRTLKEIIHQVNVDDTILHYITSIVQLTRTHTSLSLGASPRASITILNTSKALAALRVRDFVTPEDIAYITPAVLRHRISLTAEKEMDGSTTDDVIQAILHQVEVPR
jgi:MoxR-like ATPase